MTDIGGHGAASGQVWLASAISVFSVWAYAEMLAASSFGSLPLGVLLALFALYLGIGVFIGVSAGLFIGASTGLISRLRSTEFQIQDTSAATRLFAVLVFLLAFNAWNFEQVIVHSTVLKLLSAGTMGLMALLALRRVRPRHDDSRWLYGLLVALALLNLARMYLTSDLSERSEKVGCVVFVVFMIAFGLVVAAATKRGGTGLGRAAALIVSAMLLLLGARSVGTWTIGNTPLRAASLAGDVSGEIPPNLIMIVIDTARADLLGTYGATGDHTPDIDRFAQDSMVMDYAWSTSSWTLPAHATLLTGTYPYRHGAHKVGGRVGKVAVWRPSSVFSDPVDDSLPTLAEGLSARGYRCGGIVSNYGYAARFWGFAKGFQYYDDRARIREAPYASFAEFVLGRWLTSWHDAFFRRKYRPAADILDEALGWIGDGDAPFFLFINLMDVHDPYFPHPPSERGRIEASMSVLPPQNDVISKERSLTDEEYRLLHGLYVDEMRYVDQQLGRFFAVLKDRGLYDDAAIVLTADHGEAFGERPGFVAHGFSVYEQETRIPLIAKYPQSSIKGRSQAWASLVDVMPTLLRLAGGEIPDTVQGKDLRALDGTRVLFAELYQNDRHATTYGPRFGRDRRAILFEDSLEKVIIGSKDAAELYAIAEDPDEARDLSAAHEARVKEALAIAEALDADRTEGGGRDLGEEVEERLKSLGYLK